MKFWTKGDIQCAMRNVQYSMCNIQCAMCNGEWGMRNFIFKPVDIFRKKYFKNKVWWFEPPNFILGEHCFFSLLNHQRLGLGALFGGKLDKIGARLIVIGVDKVVRCSSGDGPLVDYL